MISKAQFSLVASQTEPTLRSITAAPPLTLKLALHSKLYSLLFSAVFITSLIFIFSAFYVSPAQAEPWLANRYAQNCAACHSPSRRNVQPIERRCTLSCQGCHTNPNGGGLRNEYGVWNQQRWLRSFKSSFFGNKSTPAPLKYQRYAKMPKNFFEASNKNSDKKWAALAKKGPPLVVTKNVDYDERAYDRSDKEELIDVTSRTEFLARVTEDDPYRVERRQSVFAGGDFRYFYMNYKKDRDVGNDVKFNGFIAMAFDMGVKVRPVPEHVSFVFENRFMQGPDVTTKPQDQKMPERVFTSGSTVRSAYVLVDDLPWASFAMYGLYRPEFGHYNPDHTTLLNNIIFADNTAINGTPVTTFDSFTATASRSVYRALSIGGSPNVPFANLHIIMPTETNFNGAYSANPFLKDKGFAINAGGRFVTLGASFMLSYWSTKGPRQGSGPDVKNNMLSLTAGGMYKNFILNADYTKVDRGYYDAGLARLGTDGGVVTTLETKYRFWREFYGVFNYAKSNVARNLKNGSSNEMMFGVKTFLIPGSELEALMISRNDTDDDNNKKTKSSSLQVQYHLYF